MVARYSDESKKTDITVWGYRNVWFRFEPHDSCHQWEVSETQLLADGSWPFFHSHLSPKTFHYLQKARVFFVGDRRKIYLFDLIILNLKDQTWICWKVWYFVGGVCQSAQEYMYAIDISHSYWNLVKAILREDSCAWKWIFLVFLYTDKQTTVWLQCQYLVTYIYSIFFLNSVCCMVFN